MVGLRLNGHENYTPIMLTAQGGNSTPGITQNVLGLCISHQKEPKVTAGKNSGTLFVVAATRLNQVAHTRSFSFSPSNWYPD